MTALPIEDILADIAAHLARANNALIIAPPGAGKSTVLPHTLLAQSWTRDRQIILLQPRRVAVRSVAAQLARLSGTLLGGLVGYQMRDDSKRSAGTRLLVMTQGVLRRRLLADPELSGVAAVLFDEYHERSLDSDLCLALSRDVQASLRLDLKLLILSATLDADKLRPTLPGFKVFQSEGRSYPIETRYMPPAHGVPAAQSVVRGISHALNTHDGNVLCFLPGQGDIRRAFDAVSAACGPDVETAMLYGGLTDREQSAALSPPSSGMRKVILATDIAETSLTVPGVHSVVDTGLRRAPMFDARLGLTQLKGLRAAQDRLDQRRGRAGRVAPGLCIRLWPEQEMRSIAASSAPDVETQDLTDVVLACADWGVRDVLELPWTSPLASKGISMAQEALQRGGLLDHTSRITPRGRQAARLPLPAYLATLLLEAAGTAGAGDAALLCALLSDGTPRGRSCVDLEEALHSAAYGAGAHIRRLQKRANSWLKQVDDVEGKEEATGQAKDTPPAGVLLARARPQLIAKRRGGTDGSFKLAAGRGAFVEEGTALAKAPYLVVGDALLAGEEVRITSAWPLSQAQVDTYLHDLIETKTRQIMHDKTGRRQVERSSCIGALVIRSQREDIAAGPELAQLMRASLREKGLSALPWPKAFHTLKNRADFARAHGGAGPDLSDDALLESSDAWLMPLLEQADSLSRVSGEALFEGVRGIQDFQLIRALDAFAPTHFSAPAGQRLPIDYSAAPAPSVSAKLQAFLGLKAHPTIAQGQVGLMVVMLSPAGRPLQSTQDLPGFWAGSYSDVRREMRGRYPKHPWPEDPANAQPTLLTKNRLKHRS